MESKEEREIRIADEFRHIEHAVDYYIYEAYGDSGNYSVITLINEFVNKEIAKAEKSGAIKALKELSLKDVTGDYEYNGKKYIRGQLIRLYDVLEAIQKYEQEGVE